MVKIEALLEQSGCKPELVGKIVESLSNYKESVKSQYDAEFKSRIAEAKKVCVEETENHKRELARRVQIFCESKGAAIESQLTKSAAQNESEAQAKLRQVKNLLEGIKVGTTNARTEAAFRRMENQLRLANEAKVRAVATANRQTAIAEKVLKKNRQLVSENANLKTQRPVLSENKASQGSRRIDKSRRVVTPSAVTRPAILENQDRRKPKPNGQVITGPTGFGVEHIASVMDENI